MGRSGTKLVCGDAHLLPGPFKLLGRRFRATVWSQGLFTLLLLADAADAAC